MGDRGGDNSGENFTIVRKQQTFAPISAPRTESRALASPSCAGPATAGGRRQAGPGIGNSPPCLSINGLHGIATAMRAINTSSGHAEPASAADGLPPPLDHSLGFHLHLAHGALQRHFAATFSQIGLTRTQLSVLWLLRAQPAMSQVDIGHRLQMDRATTMGIINRLQARHLLRRERSAADGRKQALYLEPQGEAVLDAARDAFGAHEAWTGSHFTAAESHALIELLARLHG